MSEPIEAFKNAFKIPELKNRIIFTLIMLAVYRLGCHVPTPGVDGAALAAKMSQAGGLLGFYDMFSGGAFSRATVFALGIMPYITASIILSLLIPVVPALENLQKQGQEGQKKITEYTRYGTIGLCIVQSIGIAVFLQSLGTEIVPRPGIGFILMCIISFTTGTAFIMWLGEQISEQGIGNGISLIIFTSIISRMPAALRSLVSLIFVSEQINMFQGLFLVFLMVLVVAGAILITTGQRRIPVQYPRQVKGRRVSGGQRTYLPLRVNQAGVMPIIFAISVALFPGQIAQALMGPTTMTRIAGLFHVSEQAVASAMLAIRTFTTPGENHFASFLYFLLVILFTYFYTAVTFNPEQISENLQKNGGAVPGIRPGASTRDYLDRILYRITLAGALFLGLIALMQYYVGDITGVTTFTLVGGTSLLIVVGVALDTMQQIEAQLLMRHYSGFLK